MGEKVTTYLLSNPEDAMPMDRDEFYSAQVEAARKKRKPNRAIEVVLVLLFTKDREIILQKRSRRKGHNPGMFDKTVGGHVPFGDSPNYTVMCETLQELSIPAYILNDGEDFIKTFRLLKDHINNASLIQKIDTRTVNLPKLINGEMIPITDKYHFYLGVYSGAIRPADKESAGVLFFGYKSLREEMDLDPTAYTDDLRFLLKKYEKNIEAFLKSLS